MVDSLRSLYYFNYTQTEAQLIEKLHENPQSRKNIFYSNIRFYFFNGKSNDKARTHFCITNINLPSYLPGIKKIAQGTEININRPSLKNKVFHRKYFIIRTGWFPMFKIYLLCYFYK